MIRLPSDDEQDQMKEKTLPINLRTKLQQWNSEVQQQMRRRRLSQQSNSRRGSQSGNGENSVSQWWHWQGTGETDNGMQKPDLNMTVDVASLSTPVSSKGRKTIIRTSSLKEQQKQIIPETTDIQQTNTFNKVDLEEGLQDDVFVRADPINRGQKINVKNAIISSTATGTVMTNPYCTTARAPKTASTMATKRALKLSSVTNDSHNNHRHNHISHATIPNSPRSLSNGTFSSHDQDSGYDGYCPDKSITSLGSSLNTCSSENASLMSSASSNASHSSNEESHYGNSSGKMSLSAAQRGVGFATTAAIYGRISRQANCRPTSVYEKQFNGPVQHSLQFSTEKGITVSSTSSSPNSPSSCSSTPPPIPPPPTSLSIIKSPTNKRSQHIDGLNKPSPLLVRTSVPNHSPNKAIFSSNNNGGNVPPPLPPRPSNLTPSSVISPNKIHSVPQHENYVPPTHKYNSNILKHSTASLPRTRKSRKQQLVNDDVQKRRESYHNANSDSDFSQPLSLAPIDLNRSYQINYVDTDNEQAKKGKDIKVCSSVN